MGGITVILERTDCSSENFPFLLGLICIFWDVILSTRSTNWTPHLPAGCNKEILSSPKCLKKRWWNLKKKRPLTLTPWICDLSERVVACVALTTNHARSALALACFRVTWPREGAHRITVTWQAGVRAPQMVMKLLHVHRRRTSVTHHNYDNADVIFSFRANATGDKLIIQLSKLPGNI